MALGAAAVAGGLAAAAYLDGKFQLKRDLTTLFRLKKIERECERRVAKGETSVWYALERTVKQYPNSRAIWTRERSWTFQEMYDHSLQLAQWMLEQNIRPGDLVALYLLNSAEFLMLVFATFAIGAAVAPINYNLEGKALLHCLSVSESKVLIVDPDPTCQERVNGSRKGIEAAGTKIFTLDDAFKRAAGTRPVVVPDDELRRNVDPLSPFVMLYTSGTTGMPKLTSFTMYRAQQQIAYGIPSFECLPGKDCWYEPMPLYHGTGLCLSVFPLLTGVGVALAPRFTVSGFWPDICESGATAFVYVGETARYLLAAPPHPLERAHNVRLAHGNGLRPDVWHKLQERFNIPQIAEFFNSSEGVFSLLVYAKNDYLNACVGHHGLLLRALLHKTYVPVKIDYETGGIWRDPETGFAQRTSYDEGGEMLVAVPDRSAFGGYRNSPDATEKRFAVDVFQKGDLYYRSGDALRRSPDGHWAFLDRLGDTYRWKSENVSTAEVAEILGRYPGIAEANVFGVSVPGHEGRAGCAAINIEGQLDYAELVQYARRQLPRYAVPVFLRVVKRSAHIHNHKQNKVGLRKEGVDPDKVGTEEKEGVQDTFLWQRPGTDSYEPFERKDWEKLVRREVRL